MTPPKIRARARSPFLLLAGLVLLAGCYGSDMVLAPDGAGAGNSGTNGGQGTDPFGEPSDIEEGQEEDFDWSTVAEPELAPGAVVVEDHPCFESVTETYEDSQEELIFTFVCDPASVGLDVGDVVVGVVNGGYLREITELEVSGFTVVAQTMQATLSQVLVDGGFETEIEFDGAERYTMDFSGRTLYSGTHGGTNLDVKLSEGIVNINPKLQMAVEFGWFSVKRSDAILKLDMDADLEMMAQLSDTVSFSGSTELGTYSYPFAFAAGPVPVAGTLDLTLSAGFRTTAEATATATVGVEAEAAARIGGKYRNGRWYFVQEKSFDAHRTGPDFNVEGDWDGKVWIKAEAKLKLYRVAGPSFYVAPFLKGEAHAECSDLDWEFFAGADAGAGLHLEVLHWGVHKNFGPWTWEESVGEGTIELPFPIGSNCEPEAAECFSSGTISCGQTVSGNTATSLSAGLAMDAYPVNVGNYEAPDVTYTWQASGSNEVEFRFVNPHPTEVNHDIMILDGSSGSCLNTNAVDWGLNSVTFEPTGGSTYFIVVDGYDGDAGPFELTLDCNP